jgi:hypothetical protein
MSSSSVEISAVTPRIAAEMIDGVTRRRSDRLNCGESEKENAKEEGRCTGISGMIPFKNEQKSLTIGCPSDRGRSK